MFLYAGGRYYDAEAPDGVVRFEDLPLFTNNYWRRTQLHALEALGVG